MNVAFNDYDIYTLQEMGENVIIYLKLADKRNEPDEPLRGNVG